MSRAILLPARPQSHERRRNAGPQLLVRYCFVCDTPYPDVPVPISRTAAVRSPSQRKNSPRKPEVMRVNYLMVAWPAIDCPDQEAYDISATVDDYFLKAPTRHIAAKLSARAAIHWDDRPGSGHLFYQIRPWRWVL